MNWSYIAGFFDGEGSVLLTPKRCRAALAQTSLPVLEAIHTFTRLGGIYSIPRRKAHWKDSWTYFTAGQRDSLRFLRGIQPYAIVKREKIDEAIRALVGLLARRSKRDRLLRWRIKGCIALRKKGLTYREIGKRLDMDWGYARTLYRRFEMGRRP